MRLTSQKALAGAEVPCRSGRRSAVMCRASAEGKKVLITGGNAGIGFESAKALCAKGYDVTIACKDPARAAAAVEKIRSGQAGANISSIRLDLGDLQSVDTAVKRLVDSDKAAFDVLLNNAGVMATPKMQTKDGFEFQLGVNHLGHYALTNMLLPYLTESGKHVRIINVASAAHVSGSIKFDDLFRDKPGAYQPWEAYGQSKLANIMFTYELARKLRDQPNITVNCLHPGVVRTELGRYMLNDKNTWYMGPAIVLASLFFKTPEQGAQTSIHLATSPEVATLSSKYFVDCKPTTSSPASYDTAVAAKLWDVSAELVSTKVKTPITV